MLKVESGAPSCVIGNMPSEEKEELTWLEGLKVGDKVAIVRIVPGAPDNVSEGVVVRRTKTQIFVNNGSKFSSKSGWASSSSSSFLRDRIVEPTDEMRGEISQQRTLRVLSKRLENLTGLVASKKLSEDEVDDLIEAIIAWRTKHNVDC